MRIAFVVGRFPKTSETFILRQITGLIDRGHEVDIYAFRSLEKTSKTHVEIEKYALLKNTYFLPYISSNPIKRLIQAFSSLGSSRDKSLKKILHLINLPFTGFKYWPHAWINASVMPSNIEPYDIIHCHFVQYNKNALCLKAITSPKAKIITTFHGFDVNVRTKDCNAGAYKEIFKQGDLFTSNTHFTAKKAAMLGCPPEKIEILPVGLDVHKYPFSPRHLNEDGIIQLLTVGRLVEKKGIDYSIRAVAEIKKLRPDLRFEYTIVGDGGMRASLEALAKDLGVASNVHFLGTLTQEEVQDIYKASHIFILPSVTASNGDMEGQGLVIQEAQCVGLPVISTLHNGIPDGVLDGQSAFLVPEKDVSALVEKLLYLSLNPHLWPEMGRTGHQFVTEKYYIEDLNDRLVELYRCLLPKQKALAS